MIFFAVEWAWRCQWEYQHLFRSWKSAVLLAFDWRHRNDIHKHPHADDVVIFKWHPEGVFCELVKHTWPWFWTTSWCALIIYNIQCLFCLRTRRKLCLFHIAIVLAMIWIVSRVFNSNNLLRFEIYSFFQLSTFNIKFTRIIENLFSY